MKRFDWLDGARGAAVLAMVAYHIFFDLEYLDIADIGMNGLGWKLFQRAIAFSFLFIVGISLVLAYSRKKSKWPWFRRVVILSSLATVITMASWLFDPERFISFGVIHLIALSSLLFPFARKLGDWMVPFALTIIIAGFFLGNSSPPDPNYLFWMGIHSSGYNPLDHYPMIPWFGIILLGISAGERLTHSSRDLKSETYLEGLALIGRNAILVYVIHQPVLIGLLMILTS